MCVCVCVCVCGCVCVYVCVGGYVGGWFGTVLSMGFYGIYLTSHMSNSLILRVC